MRCTIHCFLHQDDNTVGVINIATAFPAKSHFLPYNLCIVSCGNPPELQWICCNIYHCYYILFSVHLMSGNLTLQVLSRTCSQWEGLATQDWKTNYGCYYQVQLKLFLLFERKCLCYARLEKWYVLCSLNMHVTFDLTIIASVAYLNVTQPFLVSNKEIKLQFCKYACFMLCTFTQQLPSLT